MREVEREGLEVWIPATWKGDSNEGKNIEAVIALEEDVSDVNVMPVESSEMFEIGAGNDAANTIEFSEVAEIRVEDVNVDVEVELVESVELEVGMDGIDNEASRLTAAA